MLPGVSTVIQSQRSAVLLSATSNVNAAVNIQRPCQGVHTSRRMAKKTQHTQKKTPNGYCQGKSAKSDPPQEAVRREEPAPSNFSSCGLKGIFVADSQSDFDRVLYIESCFHTLPQNLRIRHARPDIWSCMCASSKAQLLGIMV